MIPFGPQVKGTAHWLFMLPPPHSRSCECLKQKQQSAPIPIPRTRLPVSTKAKSATTCAEGKQNPSRAFYCSSLHHHCRATDKSHPLCLYKWLTSPTPALRTTAGSSLKKNLKTDRVSAMHTASFRILSPIKMDTRLELTWVCCI